MTNWLAPNPFEERWQRNPFDGAPAEPHVIARRSTYDGKHVLLWDDGSLTWALGYSIKGSAHPRTEKQRETALRAGWLVMGEVSLYEADEVPDLIKAARWVAQRSGDPGDVRKRFHEKTSPRLIPQWTVLETDRDGRPTLRVWRLPRLRYPGTAIWDERGRYEIMYEIDRSGTYRPSGLRAASLREIVSMLPEPS